MKCAFRTKFCGGRTVVSVYCLLGNQLGSKYVTYFSGHCVGINLSIRHINNDFLPVSGAQRPRCIGPERARNQYYSILSCSSGLCLFVSGYHFKIGPSQ